MSLDQLYHEIAKELDINPDDLNFEMQRQPAKFAYWGALYSRSLKKLQAQKMALNELEAKLSRDYRLAMADREPNTRITESMVRTFVILTDEYKEQAKRVIYAQHEADLLETAKRAFQQRASMLLELGRTRREEMFGTDMNIFTKEARDRYEKRHKEGDKERAVATAKFKGLLGGKKDNE